MLKIVGICFTTAGLVLGAGPVGAQGSQSKGCFVAHFKSLALKTHDPQLRAELAEQWLQRNTPSCTKFQLSSLQANSPNWLGSALTLEISSILEGAIETSISGNPELMGRLYESLGKEGTSGNVTLTNPVARAPVVQPMVNNGVIPGSANYGNISGNTNLNQTTNNLSNANSNARTAANSTLNPTNPIIPTNPVARPPVVQPMVNNGLIPGSANYGNISGNTNLNQTTNNLSNANSNARTTANSSVTDTSNTQIGQGSPAANIQGRPQTPR
jgi:hypothetical protein